MFPQPQQPALEAGTERPFNADSRDGARFQQQAAPVIQQGQYPQQQPVMVPQVQVPYAAPGAPASPIPQGQSVPVNPGMMTAFGLPVPQVVVQTPQSPQQLPQQQMPQQQPYNPMQWFQQGYAPQQVPVQQQHVPGQQQVIPQQQQIPAEQMSAFVQQQSEAAYGTALYRAMNEPAYLEQMASSQNPVEQQLARKVLERNSEHFGAGTVEEFKANLAIQKAGDDPVQQQLAQMQQKQIQDAKIIQDMQWNAWKNQNGVKEDAFGTLVDAVRKEYPNAQPHDVVHMARGRAGITNQQQPTIESEAGINAIGGGGARGGTPPDQSVNAEGMALFGLTPQMQNSTETYMRTIGAIR